MAWWNFESWRPERERHLSEWSTEESASFLPHLPMRQPRCEQTSFCESPRSTSFSPRRGFLFSTALDYRGYLCPLRAALTSG